MSSDINVIKGRNFQVDEIKKLPDLKIAEVRKIEPVAVHLKELNNIDPLTIDAMHVDSVRNIAPVSIDKLNITRIPHVNLSVRQAPPLDISVRKVPPLDVNLNQTFSVPSSYTVHAQFLGFEFMRFFLHGNTTIYPHDKQPCAYSTTPDKSYPINQSGNKGSGMVTREMIAQRGMIKGVPAVRHGKASGGISNKKQNPRQLKSTGSVHNYENKSAIRAGMPSCSFGLTSVSQQIIPLNKNDTF
jgi:hypothetical protein